MGHLKFDLLVFFIGRNRKALGLMQKIKHIFFDLDRTIWDFEKNSHDTLVELWVELKLANLGVSLVEEFIKIYKEINEECWGSIEEENYLSKN